MDRLLIFLLGGIVSSNQLIRSDRKSFFTTSVDEVGHELLRDRVVLSPFVDPRSFYFSTRNMGDLLRQRFPRGPKTYELLYGSYMLHAPKLMDVSSILQDGSFFDWRFFHFSDNMRMVIGTNNSPMATTEVAKRLEALRAAIPLGKGEFADSIDIDRSSYSKIIKGEKPLKIEMGYVVAERWGVSLDFLYRGRLGDLPAKYAKSIAAALTTTQE